MADYLSLEGILTGITGGGTAIGVAWFAFRKKIQEIAEIEAKKEIEANVKICSNNFLKLEEKQIELHELQNTCFDKLDKFRDEVKADYVSNKEFTIAESFRKSEFENLRQDIQRGFDRIYDRIDLIDKSR